jgi:hypothetical protein
MLVVSQSMERDTNHAPDIQRVVLEMIDGLLTWADQAGMATYDWWDIWGTSFGQWAKRSYFRKSPLGYMGVAGLQLLDWVYPGHRRFYAEKRTFPICTAHFGIGFLNLWETTREQKYYDRAIAIIEPLLALASPRANGLGWGMKHEWMTIQGLVRPDTPCNTQTAYGYEFFSRLLDLSGDERYRQHLERIAWHVSHDFRETSRGNLLSCSYSTDDDRRVVNANSYRMYMLLDAGFKFKNDEYTTKGLGTLRYVLSMQNPDGSWPYSEDQDFVDGYHTCFVLKNLLRSRRYSGDLCGQLDDAFERGSTYFFTRLVNANDVPVPFSVTSRLTLYKFDSYDLAEAMSLICESGKEKHLLEPMIDVARRRFLTKDGWFAFRLYKGLPVRGIPYMRYANSAMFLALSKVHHALRS